MTAHEDMILQNLHLILDMLRILDHLINFNTRALLLHVDKFLLDMELSHLVHPFVPQILGSLNHLAHLNQLLFAHFKLIVTCLLLSLCFGVCLMVLLD